MGRYSKNQYRLIPKRKSNLIEMHRAGTRVRSCCRKCGIMLDVNVHLLMAYHGEHFTLIDKIARCRVYDCDGETFFLASPSENTPFRPLLTE